MHPSSTVCLKSTQNGLHQTTTWKAAAPKLFLLPMARRRASFPPLHKTRFPWWLLSRPPHESGFWPLRYFREVERPCCHSTFLLKALLGHHQSRGPVSLTGSIHLTTAFHTRYLLTRRKSSVVRLQVPHKTVRRDCLGLPACPHQNGVITLRLHSPRRVPARERDSPV